MLIDGEKWTGNTVHFASGRTLSMIVTMYDKNQRLYKTKEGTYIQLPNSDIIEYMELDPFSGATSLDDPIVKEWEKEHAYKERP